MTAALLLARFWQAAGRAELLMKCKQLLLREKEFTLELWAGLLFFLINLPSRKFLMIAQGACVMLKILLMVHSAPRSVHTGRLPESDGERSAKANTLHLIWDEMYFL